MKYGVAGQDGTEFQAPRVISRGRRNVTFVKLMEPKDLPAEFLAAVKRIDYNSATVKINVAVDRVPNWKALAFGREGGPAAPRHHALPEPRLHRAPSTTRSTVAGQNPMIECTMATAAGQHAGPGGSTSSACSCSTPRIT
ncbi:MAG: hypothetical protein U0792_22625 [Gemmataceae bacterium]